MEWKLGDITIKPLLTEKIPQKILKGSTPKVVHLAIIDYDSVWNQMKLCIRTAPFIVDNPENEVWNEDYKAWLTKLDVNGFQTWGVLFF